MSYELPDLTERPAILPHVLNRQSLSLEPQQGVILRPYAEFLRVNQVVHEHVKATFRDYLAVLLSEGTCGGVAGVGEGFFSALNA